MSYQMSHSQRFLQSVVGNIEVTLQRRAVSVEAQKRSQKDELGVHTKSATVRECSGRQLQNETINGARSHGIATKC